MVLLGAVATEEGLRAALAESAPTERWRAVHFASHGLVDMEKPQFSCLALSGSATSDGFFRTAEIARARIPAGLIVLSACETARGKVYKSEGILGLTRTFMFADAPRVICSLWKVDDAAT